MTTPLGVTAIRRFWSPPDQFLIDAGKQGEILIARIRIGLTLILLAIPVANLALALEEERQQHIAGFWITFAAFALSLIIYLLVARDRREPWLPMMTSMFDVSLISFALLVYAFIGDPHQVVNSKITFDTYFIALAGTCLRFDKRVALLAGLMAMVQFTGIIVFVDSTYTLDTVGGVSPYGRFAWSEQISRLILLAAMTALNVYIVSGIQRQRELSNADPLTGLFNRRFFDDYFATEVQRATRYNNPVAVAMIDVDHFKQFNDLYGHATGDIALKRVGRALSLAIRRSDVLARYGGEEFVVLFRETSAGQALERVEHIRRAVESEPLIDGTAVPVRVTVSAGVASWPADGDSVSDLIAEADRRLFQAKNAGRNRVVGPAHAADEATESVARA
jgi:diguanylate cyclase (GGDEF)-like protein